jgi:hypothetical protein
VRRFHEIDHLRHVVAVMLRFRELPTTSRLLLAALGALVAYAGAVALTAWGVRPLPWGTSRLTAGEVFEAETGWNLPAGSRVVLHSDTHGGLHGDGDLCIVLEAPPAALKSWLDAAPPWGNEAWERGAAPWAAWENVDLEGAVAEARSRGQHVPNWASTIGPAVSAATERSPAGTWRNGAVLAIDARQGRVWLYRWDL